MITWSSEDHTKQKPLSNTINKKYAPDLSQAQKNKIDTIFIIHDFDYASFPSALDQADGKTDPLPSFKEACAKLMDQKY